MNRDVFRGALAAAVAAAALASLQQSCQAQALTAADCGYATCSDLCTDACTEACDCGDAACGPVCCNPWGHCTALFGDVLWLHPTGADMVHAQQQNGTGGAGTVPFGIIGAADPDYEPGFRVGGVLALTESSSFVAAYSFLEADSASTVLAPVVPGGGGAVGSLVHHPGAAITSSAGPVNSAYEIDFQMADFKYHRLLVGDNLAWINYSVGARYAHLEQEFFQTGVFAGSSAGQIDTHTSADFDGAGALFGLDAERIFGDRGFSLYGSVGVSPIFGQFSSFYSMTNATTDVLLANAVWKDDRVVTILDFELGVAWTSESRLWRVSSGYLAQFWYDTITTPELVDAVQANNYTGVGDTLSFDGLTARIERRF